MEMAWNILFYILIVAMLSVFCECTGNTKTNYNITCEGNGTIRIKAPAGIKSVASECSNGKEFVDVPDNKIVTVNNCQLNQNVSILMYNVQKNIVMGSNNIIDKLETKAFVVMCDGTGLTVDTSFNNSAASFKPLIVTDQETLTMKVFDKSESNNQEVKTIKVGGSYTLQIEAADDLTIHVQSCTASSGGDGTEEVQLYENGSYIKEIGVFQGDFGTQLKTASIGMTGFRFVGKDTVVITCTVDVSTPTTTPTPTTTTTTTVPTSTTTTTVPTSTTTTTVRPTSTPANVQPSTTGTHERKRRNAFQEKHTKNLAVSTSLRVESHYESTNGVKGMGGNEGRCMWIASILIVKYSLLWF